MRAGILLIALLSIVTLAGCGGKSGGGAADRYLSGMNKIAEAVEKVKDEADARQATQVIASVSTELKEVADAMGKMSDAEKEMIFARRTADFQKECIPAETKEGLQKLERDDGWL